MSTDPSNASAAEVTTESDLESSSDRHDRAKPGKGGLKLAFAMLLALAMLVYMNMG